jgi:hypothetical protein
MMIAVLFFVAAACLAFGYVGYVLWPRWPKPPVLPAAPALPIVISGVKFNVPPSAIRRAVQRQTGTQERIDLVYLWPSLTPPEPLAQQSAGKRGAPPSPADRVFVTIAANADAVAPADRLKVIYPRYTTGQPSTGPDGLMLFSFRDGTPYQGEDLLLDHTAPERFLVRCTRNGSTLAPGVCLYERFVGAAHVTLRFPRDWLSEWRSIVTGVDRLIEQWRPAAG